MPSPARQSVLRRRLLAQRSARSRGVVIVIALFATILIAGLIGYVFNTGRHAQLKIETQNAADATAVGGAGYIARSFNLVAMNNVEISRLIATVQHLDALPLATEYTLVDEIAHRDSLERIAISGHPDRARLLDIVANQVREQEGDIQTLEQMDNFFRNRPYDVRDLTFYDGPNGRGELWRAMESLDALSQATMENLAQLAQVAANEAGLSNLSRREGALAAIIPINADYAWRTYDFDEFERPVTRGMLPEYVDDVKDNRGPYDAVFGWRELQVETEYGPLVGGTDRTQSGNFESGWSRRSNQGGGRRPVISREVTGYRTYGTWNWLARSFLSNIGGNSENNGLGDTALWTRFSGMSQVKLNYLWPGQRRSQLFIGIREPEDIDHARAPNIFLEPEWVINYTEAEAIRDAGTPRIVYARYLAVEFLRTEVYRQVYVDGEPQGNRQQIDEFEQDGRSEVINTFNRREFFRPPGLGDNDLIGTMVWEDPLSQPDIYESATVTIDQQGREIREVTSREVYSTFYFFWLGVNVGPLIEIRDPNNFGSRAELPGPVDFEHGQIDRPINGEVGRPGSQFAFLAIAAQPNRADMWPSRFRESVHEDVTAVAQAGVFNNHSFDLWTQMWYAQLEPVQDFPGWLDYAGQVSADAGVYPDLDQARLEATLEYFEALRPLSEVLMNH